MFADRENLIMEAVAALERQRELTARSEGTMSDYEDDSLLDTYLRIKAEGQYKEPTRSDSSWSEQSGFDEFNEHTWSYGNQGITETASEICSQGGSRFDTFHGTSAGHHIYPTEQSRQVQVRKLGKGSPVRKREEPSLDETSFHKGSARVNETKWSDSLHMDVEQLNIELERIGRTDPSFLRQFRNVYGEMEEEEGRDQNQEMERISRSHEDGSQIAFVMTPKREKNLPEAASLSGKNGALTRAATRWNEYLMRDETTIEVSDVFDSDEEHGGGSSSLQHRGDSLMERRQRTKEKWEAKELQECTFRPQLSRASVSMFQKSSQSRDSVFQRLYQRNFAGKRSEGGNNSSVRELLLAEKDQLREMYGGATSTKGGADSFELFMFNILGSKDEQKAAFVDTKYQSPLARKLMTVRHENTFNRTTSYNGGHHDSGSSRGASFDSFLLRQDRHLANRTRTVRQIEESQRPSFKPQITNTSVRIAKRLLARSESEVGNVKSAPTLAAAVKKHRSPYVDPCTFKPETAPGSSGAKPSGVEVLFLDSVRRRNSIKAAQEKARSAEMKHPFKPTLNDERNRNVESYLSSKHLVAYTENLKRQKERLAEMREQKEREKEREMVEQTTFRPKISRTPAYIRRMASSFALVRQQCGN
ncbi:hypothetical protein, conserved [Trypanosoma brucei gambiense DAL972]|uniref:Uncharacterized protein n=1 Tax=Trypanosoma brucei gambiense (strain MHOM/CI/86/DAL972) TaxID=679716 RepID=D0AA46_TRYB9|nr:hypothetical protein, conserved [Trypanosoma brucei gambiense DAL972]CBH18547.1 hypothetical protein, conserved [Trypanosoma brucei gambiense DAL972]|eukprot:XP_011780811.1 hypothetical protein, conserved [Trypanosoma brucei gambiense DAL972]